jgi:hypothetical protein
MPSIEWILRARTSQSTCWKVDRARLFLGHYRGTCIVRAVKRGLATSHFTSIPIRRQHQRVPAQLHTPAHELAEPALAEAAPVDEAKVATPAVEHGLARVPVEVAPAEEAKAAPATEEKPAEAAPAEEAKAAPAIEEEPAEVAPDEESRAAALAVEEKLAEAPKQETPSVRRYLQRQHLPKQETPSVEEKFAK